MNSYYRLRAGDVVQVFHDHGYIRGGEIGTVTHANGDVVSVQFADHSYEYQVITMLTAE